MNEPKPFLIPDSDTEVVRSPVRSGRPRVVKTKFKNLWRDRMSGTYFVATKVCGKLFRKSLNTKTQTVALARRDRELESARTRLAGPSRRPNVSEWRMRELAALWARIISGRTDLKPRAIEYRLDLRGKKFAGLLSVVSGGKKTLH